MSSPVTEVEPPSLPEASPPGTDLAPVGVQRERVDPYTLLVVGKLFPAPTSGLEFLALLLRWAIVKQLSHGLGDSDHAAVIAVQSIRQLATTIGWSYETTHKYVVLFCTLGLLTKRRINGKVELYFALGRYEPPLTLDALDALIEKYRHRKRGGKTDKRLKHAERVKRRFLLLYGDRQRAELPSHSPGACNPVAADLQDAIGEVQLLLKVETSEVTRERLAVLLTKLERVQGRFADMQVDGRYHLLPAGPPTSDKGEQEQSEESTQGDDPGRREVVVSASNLPKLPHQVDSSSPMATRKGRFIAHKVDPLIHEPDAQGRLSHAKVDLLDSGRPDEGGSREKKSTLSALSEAQKGRLLTQQIDTTAKKVDSEVSATLPNVNVITLISNITSNVRLVAAFCRQALEEPPSKQPIYLKLFHECEHDEQAIAAALLFTLAHRRDGTIRRPAAVFIARCRDYHTKGIPDEAAALVEQYGSLSCAQFLDALGKSAPCATVPQALPHREIPVPGTPPSLPPLPQMTDLAPLIPLRPRGGMTCEDARRLRGHIAHDQRVGLCRTGLVALADGTYGVLLDNTVSRTVRQVAFYSAEEWQQRSALLTDCFTLFASDGEEMIHPLRRVLKGNTQP